MSRILIIEDDMMINGLLRNIIEKNGYAVDSAHNGTDGLAMGLHENYNLILLDLMLPKKSGEEIIRECNEEKTKELIKICLERAHYCNSLINDFFELSVLEAQGCIPKLESIDVARMICEQILAHYPIFEGKSITPYFEDSDKPVIVSADSVLLNRVIQNLISNGVKYTTGDIFFRVCQENGQITITVSNPIDTYVDVTRIFDRFYTQDKSRSKGSGIGLYICRQFIEAMGGRISAEIDRNYLSINVTLNSA